MNKLIKEVNELSKMKRKFFIETVVYEKKLEKEFFNILKNIDKNIFDLFLKDLPKEAKEFWKKSVNEVKSIESNLLENSMSKFISILEGLEEMIKELEAGSSKVQDEIYKRRELLYGYPADENNYLHKFISDQSRGIEIPPVQKEIDDDDDKKNNKIISLPKPTKNVLLKDNILDNITDRKSRRKFTKEQLSLEELSYLLYSTQGVRQVIRDGKMTYRTVPSGGARQPFETYLTINYVDGIIPGVYRYQPIEHELVFLFSDDKMIEKMTEAACGQNFVGESAVCFIWSSIPYRMEWRYGAFSFKDILIEAGHVCQNLYLASESINCETCAIAAYYQEKIDAFLGLDGKNEMVVYLSPVGKL